MSLPNLSALPSLATVSYRVGRWIMFNIGFKDFIEKLEEYFGKRVTKFSVGLFGLAILVFVVGYAVTASIYPLALWLGAIVTGQPDVANAINGISTAATIVWLAGVLALLVTYFQQRRHIMRATELLEEVRQTQAEGLAYDATYQATARETMADIKQTQARTRETYLEAKKAVEDALAMEAEFKRRLDALPSPRRSRKAASPPSSAPDQK